MKLRNWWVKKNYLCNPGLRKYRLHPSERNSTHCAHYLHKCLGQLRSNMPYLSMKLCYEPLNSFEQVELWSGAHKDFSIRKNLNVNFLMHEQALRHSAMNHYESILGKHKEFWVKIINKKFQLNPKDDILQEVNSIWMQLCSFDHFSVIKIGIGAISCTADYTHSKFDDRKMGNWTELHSYWNYFFQSTSFSNLHDAGSNRYKLQKCAKFCVAVQSI